MRDFNFFEPYLYTVKARDTKKTLSIILTIVIFGSIAGFYYFNILRINSYHAHLEELDAQIEVFTEKGVMSKKNELVSEKNSLDEKLLAVADFESAINSTYLITDELIPDFVGFIPRELYLETMDISGGSISLSGFAYDRAIVAEYEYALRQSNHYEKMFVDVISEDDEQGVERFTFNLNFDIKGVE
ncbi:MAG: PilN domain-containing protein [Clostridiales bacterium]|nr:PilN domain-containing protein [Clostridiales bacterium]